MSRTVIIQPPFVYQIQTNDSLPALRSHRHGISADHVHRILLDGVSVEEPKGQSDEFLSRFRKRDYLEETGSVSMRRNARVKLVTVDYTEEERKKLKWDHMREASTWEPPATYIREVVLYPGDDGYDEAPYVMSFESGNFRCDLK